MLKTVLLLVHENNKILEEKNPKTNKQRIRQLDKARQQGWRKTCDLCHLSPCLGSHMEVTPGMDSSCCNL